MTRDQQLAALFNQETSSLQQLQNILQEEHEALIGKDLGAIERATSSKNRALANQADATNSRRRFATQSGADEGEAGIQQLIADCENREQLASSFSELMSLAQQCHEANRANGRLIAEKQLHAQQALNIIRQTDSNLPTYTGRGEAINTPGTRSLGKA